MPAITRRGCNAFGSIQKRRVIESVVIKIFIKCARGVKQAAARKAALAPRL
jgi:hypothetical protein